LLGERHRDPRVDFRIGLLTPFGIGGLAAFVDIFVSKTFGKRVAKLAIQYAPPLVALAAGQGSKGAVLPIL
jgi:hypothetical protein